VQEVQQPVSRPCVAVVRRPRSAAAGRRSVRPATSVSSPVCPRVRR